MCPLAPTLVPSSCLTDLLPSVFSHQSPLIRTVSATRKMLAPEKQGVREQEEKPTKSSSIDMGEQRGLWDVVGRQA